MDCTMRKLRLSPFLASILAGIFLLTVDASVALDRQPNADYHARREALARKVGGMVVLFAPMESEGPNDLYGFRQEDNFYYLSGLGEPGVALLIAPAVEGTSDKPAQPYTEILFLPPRNLTQEKWTGPKLGPENPEASKVTGFDHVQDMAKLPEDVMKLSTGTRPVVYTDVASHDQRSASAEPVEFMKDVNSFLSFHDLKPMIDSLRTYKDAGEIALIRKAVDASVAAHFAAFKTVKPNVSEREISALMQYEWGKRGCERPAYDPIVGSGYYSTVLHYSDDSNVMKSGDVVVIDAAGEYSMYASDITRTLPINGHFSARQREIYDIVLGAQQAAEAAFVAGKSKLGNVNQRGPEVTDTLDKVAYDYINTHGKDR